MNAAKYIGLDVHQATISVAVVEEDSKLVMECLLETQAAIILQFIAGLRGTLHVTFEEGTCAAWLYAGGPPGRERLIAAQEKRKTAYMRRVALVQDMKIHRGCPFCPTLPKSERKVTGGRSRVSAIRTTICQRGVGHPARRAWPF